MDFTNEDSEKIADKLDELAKYGEVSSLAGKILAEFEEDKDARAEQDKVFVKAFLNYKGVYPSSFKFSGASKAFAKLTAPRVLHATARLMEAVAPTGEDSFTFEPTPYPSMPALQLQLKGAGVPDEDIQKAVKIASEQAAVNLTIKVKDALDEDSHKEKLNDFVFNMCLYGTGVMQGPFAEPAASTPSSALRFLNRVTDEVRPSVQSVSPLRFYPQAGATSVEQMDRAFVYETVDKSVLRDWSMDEGRFYTDAVREIIDNHPNGDWSPMHWESEILLANKNNQVGPNGKYQLLVRHGFISGKDLKEHGVKDDDFDDNAQVMAQVWICCKRVIRLTVSELHRDRLPFYVCAYSRSPESVFGMGVAERMFCSQAAYNACERAKYDNLALSAGCPITVANVDRLYDPKDASSIGPGAVLRTKDSENNRSEEPVTFKVVPCILSPIESTQANLMMLIQDQTGIPNALLGQGGEGVHNRTSSGASLQYNSAITPLKGVLMEIENKLVIPMMTKFKEFYDMFSEDESTRGDAKVSARGISGLIARETAALRLDSLLARAAQNEAWAAQIDMNRVGQILFKQTGLAGERLTYTKAEVEENARKAQEQQAEMERMKAAGMAQVETDAVKQRAEASPIDVIMLVVSKSPERSVVQLMAIRQMLQMKGLLTPEMEAALNQSILEASHQQGVDMAARENGVVNARTKQR